MLRPLVIVALLVPIVAVAADLTVDRDPAAYFVLGIRELHLKNIALEAPGCDAGVDCPVWGRSCGSLALRQGSIPEPGQVVGDSVCASDDLFAVFRNNVAACDPLCGMIGHPGPASDCTAPFVPPILPDLDGDGQPSCGDACTIDRDDVARACGVTLPFAPCDPLRPVVVRQNADCSPAALDVTPGNFRCDLAPGVYGAVHVANGGRLDFAAGTTTICSLKTGKAVRVKSAGPAVVLIPGRGVANLGKAGDVGTGCGGLRIVSELGGFGLGKHGDYALDICTVGGQLRLGHGNNLQGHFIGDSVLSDLNNDGRCCAPAADVTTTSTTSTTNTTSTTDTTSTTTTTTTTTSTTTTSTTSTSTTTTDATSTSTSTTDTSSSTTSTDAVSTSTTTATSSTSSTTTVAGAFTRTVGYFGNHPSVTALILAAAGSIEVCGHILTNIEVDRGDSAIEALCLSPQGDARLQLARQLTAAALSTAGGGATFADLAHCASVCIDADAGQTDLAECVDEVSDFNQSGDNVRAPFDPAGPANTTACDLAFETPCNVVDPSACAAP